MTLDDTTPPPAPSDVLLSRVILSLAAIAVLSVVSITLCALSGVDVPDALPITLGSSVTGLAGVLAGRRT